MDVETAQPTATHDGCVATLQLALQQLVQQGWRRLRVDQLGHPDNGRSIRHHYSGGEWTIVVMPKLGGDPYTIRYGIHRAPLTPARLLRLILGTMDQADEYYLKAGT